MNNSGIYKIINIKTNEIYIGSSINLKKRKSDHFYLLRKNKHTNKHLQNSFNKHGENSFLFIILELCEKNICLLLEQKYIDDLKPIFNINPKAGNSLGIKHSKETIEKIRKTQTGKKKSEETKRKIGEKNKGIHRRSYENLTEDEKNIYRNKDGFVRRRKKILQLSLDGELIKEWDSCNEIMRQKKYFASHINKCCNNKRKTAYRFIWKFK